MALLLKEAMQLKAAGVPGAFFLRQSFQPSAGLIALVVPGIRIPAAADVTDPDDCPSNRVFPFAHGVVGYHPSDTLSTSLYYRRPVG